MVGNFGGPRDGPRGGTAPVNVGDEIEVTIEAVGAKGDGIAKKDGFVLFVPNTNEGDTVKVRITKVLRKVGFADVVGEGSAPASAPPQQEEESFDSADDTEDFGEEETTEEPAEETAEEEKQEVAEEAPAEEEPVEEEAPEEADKEEEKKE